MYIIPFKKIQTSNDDLLIINHDGNILENFVNTNSDKLINIENFPNIWNSYINNINLDSHEIIMIIYGKDYYYKFNTNLEINYDNSNLNIKFNNNNNDLEKYDKLKNGFINIVIKNKINNIINSINNFEPNNNGNLIVLQNVQREIGEKGQTGDPGPRGEKGEIGNIGPLGLRGSVGPMGPRGIITSNQDLRNLPSNNLYYIFYDPSTKEIFYDEFRSNN